MDKLQLRSLCVALGLACAAAACQRVADPPEAAGRVPFGATERSGTEALPLDEPPQPALVPREGRIIRVAASSDSAMPTSGPVSGADRAFVADAAVAGMAEVEAGRLVARKSADPAVKSFGQHLQRDHTSANEELKYLARSKGVQLSAEVRGEQRQRLAKLRSVPAAQLDQRFLRDFGTAAHTKAIVLFEREAREGQDPDLRAFAERTLPKLREHRSMAEQLQNGRRPPESPG